MTLPGLPGGDPLPPRRDLWPRVVDECYQGDPFKKVVRVGDQHYLIDETAMIELEEQNYRSMEMYFRMRLADSMSKYGLAWS